MLEARATRNSQTAQTLPTGQIQGNASREHAYNIGGASNSCSPSAGVTDTLTANFDVSWEMDLFGRLREARRVANASLAQARFNIEGTRASLAASVADDYFQAKGLIIQLADARETVRIDSRPAAHRPGQGDGGHRRHARTPTAWPAIWPRRTAQAQDLEVAAARRQRQLLILVGSGASRRWKASAWSVRPARRPHVRRPRFPAIC